MPATSTFDDRRLANNPIAIVGMAGLFPQAHNHVEYWQNIVDGVDCSSEVPADRWSLDDYHDPDPTAPDKTHARRGAFLPDIEFDPIEFGLPPNQLGVTSNVQTLSLVVARDLLADTGAPGADWYDPSRTGVVLGVVGCVPLMHPLAARLSTPVLREVAQSCGLSEQDAETIAAKYVQAFAPWEENTFPGLLANVTAGRIANRFDLGGMNCTVDAACAASLSAVRMAVAELVDGRADMMIAGGADTENSIFGYMCFTKTGALSRGDRIRPFDASADGTLLGEGIGMLALRRLADAERDGNRIYAVIRGIGSSSDGRAKSIYAPREEGQHLALRRAYEDAGVPASSVELFEAHATGTAVGDRTELAGLTTVVGDTTDETTYAALGSVKSQIGHTKGAAGTASLIKLALSLHHRMLPPTIGVEQPQAALTTGRSPFYLNTVARPWIADPRRPRRRAAASAMGFGGTNFHVVLEEHTTGPRPTDTLHRTAGVHVWHAPTPQRLVESLRSDEPSMRGPVPASSARVAIVTTERAGLIELRHRAADRIGVEPDSEHWTTPDGTYFRAAALPKVVVGALFAGQGSQYVDMGLTAALNNPAVAQAFDDANAEFADTDRPLGTIVFPPPDFGETTTQDREAALRDTEYAQPAIGALAVGQFRTVREMGLRCAAFLGHSFGELTALWAAGSLDDADFFRLARARGRAMATAPDATSDRGAMMALQCDEETAGRLIADFDDIVVCNLNAPDQVVVGGSTAQLGELHERCQATGLVARALPVSAAFHTRFVEHAVDGFRAAVATTDVREPATLVIPNTRDARYGRDMQANRDILVNQLTEPVDFTNGMQSLVDDAGCTVLVEFGPRQILSQLARRTVPDDVVTIAVDAGPLGDGDVALHRAVAQLIVLGTDLTLPLTAGPPAPAPGSGTVTLNGSDFVPAARRAAYAAALADNNTVAHAGPAALERPPVPDTAPPVPREVATNGGTAHEAAGRVGGAGQDTHEITGLLSRQTELHGQYLQGQLEVAEGLMARLDTDATPELTAIATQIARQSHTVSEAHTRANEMLASLAGLALSGPPGPATVPRSSSALHPAPSRHPIARPSTPPPVELPMSPPPAPAPTLPTGVPAEPEPILQETVEQDPALSGDGLLSTFLEIIADHTGYTTTMINPTMDLEADLGIDSIKRVQVLSAVQERHPHLPPLGPEAVAELRTIDQLVDFLTTNPEPVAPALIPAIPDLPADGPAKVGLHDLGLTRLPGINEFRGAHGPSPRAVVVEIGATRDDAGAVVTELTARGWQTDRIDLAPTTSTSWLGADWNTDGLEALLADGFHEAVDACVVLVGAGTDIGGSTQRLAAAVLVAKHATARLDRAGEAGRRSFVTVGRIDGGLGLRGTAPAEAALLGGLGGLTKTLAAEHPDLFCRALDIDPAMTSTDAAAVVATELSDAGRRHREVGVDATGARWTVATGTPGPLIRPTHPVGSDSVVVVSGGARGVTASCVRALARRVPAEFILLGRTDISGAEPGWAEGVGDAELQAAAIDALGADGQAPHPKEVTRAVAEVRARREVEATVDDLQAHGARARYVTVDITDRDAVHAALAPDAARITTIVHGAGALADAMIERKTPDELRRVMGPKLGGFAALLDALPDAPLDRVVVFCSVAGLFGNAGQSDYAVANEALSRWIATLRNGNRPMNATAIAWGAWDGGMVTPDLRTLFRSRGVPLLDPEKAAGTFADLMTIDGTAGGYVLVGPPVALGNATTTANPAEVVAVREMAGLLEEPTIQDHAIGSMPVLPLTFAIGWMIAMAEDAHVGLRVVGCRDVEVVRGLVFDGAGPTSLRAHLEPATPDSDGSRTTVRVTVRADSDDEPNPPRYRGRLVLAPDAADRPVGGPITLSALTAGTPGSGRRLYEDGVQFHGPTLQAMNRVVELTDERFVVECLLADAEVDSGAFRGDRYSPVLADVLLQAGSVLGARRIGTCLPLGIGRMEIIDALPDAAAYVVVADNLRTGPQRATIDATAYGPDGSPLLRFTDVTMINTPDLPSKFTAAVERWMTEGTTS